MLIGTGRKQQYINASSAAAFRRFTDELHARICNALDTGSKSVVFLCIGTDRSTGDSLGPLIGYKISGLRNRNVHVYGTLENPVHARNIDEVMMHASATWNTLDISASERALSSPDRASIKSLRL